MFRHLKCHLQGAHCTLLKLHTYLGLGKIKFLKYKIINFNKMFIVLRDKRFALRKPFIMLLPEDDILNVETCRSMLFVIIVFDITVQSLVKL